MGEFEIPFEFLTHYYNFELSFSLPLMSLKLIWNSPKFRTQPLMINFKPQDTSKQVPNVSIKFKTFCTYLELVIFEVFHCL